MQIITAHRPSLTADPDTFTVAHIPEGYTDLDIATFCGWTAGDGGEYFGWSVTRHDDDTATVRLSKD
jgi:hypothetical protein